MKKPLVIYHADCTDGFGAAFAAWLKFGEDAEYLPLHYGNIKHANDLPSVKGRDVYILDFSLPRGIMETLMILADCVVWLDHHKTAFEEHFPQMLYMDTSLYHETDERKTIVLDAQRSGALLAWDYFQPNVEVPKMIRHIDDRDRWQFKMEGSKEVHAALASYRPWSFEQWKDFLGREALGSFDQDNWEVFVAEGAAILRAQEQNVKSTAKNARTSLIPVEQPNGDEISYRGLSVNACLHQSELGHELANQSGTFGLIWYLGADNKVRCSLRSNGDYDVSAIARALGGGGHKNAAGFETTAETLFGWLK